MSERTEIEWADASWNPVTGCSPVSSGCAHCYASRLSERYRQKGTMKKYRQGFRVTEHYEDLEEPLHWRKPKRVFVCSMGDLFHDEVSDSFIYRVFLTIGEARQHTFLLLTKRADRMAAICRPGVLPANAWAGVSVESKATTWRIDRLREVSAAIRFVSFEPLIGPVGPVNLAGIGWAIIGGETGWAARPMQTAWVNEIFDQIQQAGIPFFFKQWGDGDEYATSHGSGIYLGRTWHEWPQGELQCTRS